ncbi:MAG: hypothetical protein PVJ73_00365 [Acidobacteriota bacterium]|jgi:hypothetical protein
MKDLDAVSEHRGHRFARPESPRIHLGNVGDEVGFDASGLTQDLGQAAEQVVVRDIFPVGLLSHGESVGSGPDRSGPFAAPAGEFLVGVGITVDDPAHVDAGPLLAIRDYWPSETSGGRRPHTGPSGTRSWRRREQAAARLAGFRSVPSSINSLTLGATLVSADTEDNGGAGVEERTSAPTL